MIGGPICYRLRDNRGRDVHGRDFYLNVINVNTHIESPYMTFSYDDKVLFVISVIIFDTLAIEMTLTLSLQWVR